jgi:hypothetical protein
MNDHSPQQKNSYCKYAALSTNLCISASLNLKGTHTQNGKHTMNKYPIVSFSGETNVLILQQLFHSSRNRLYRLTKLIKHWSSSLRHIWSPATFSTNDFCDTVDKGASLYS